MSPLTAQLWCWIAVAFFSCLALIAGFGANYFGRKSSQQEKSIQAELSKKIDVLVQGNEILQEKLQPFESLASKTYPGIETDAALGRLYREMENIKEATQPTVLVPTDRNEKELSDGSFEYSFSLEPNGVNVIPILSVTAESAKGVKINSIKVKGDTLPLMNETGSNNEETAKWVLFRAVQPASFKVVINTAKQTQLKIGVVPLKDQ